MNVTEQHYSATERSEIIQAYEQMMQKSGTFSDFDRKRVDKAFKIAMDAHEGTRRKTGEPYIYHPMAVAEIVAVEIGIDVTSIVAALLHDVVEDTDISLEELQRAFDRKTAKIIDGLTKIKDVFESRSVVTKKAENFRKLLLTLGEDIRVILIKLADRLHNMRTMSGMRSYKQREISSETIYLYAPIAHRLGLYRIKSELEDLCMKYTEPSLYKEIAKKLQQTKRAREQFIKEFVAPIEKMLQESDIENFKVYGRPKHIHSIANKIKKKQVPFEDIYDLFAIRIILDVPIEKEKPSCWRVYSLITDVYKPNPNRLRDWISNPKGNGYESLHTTVMGPKGRWVEVQIRTKRMDEIAEKGIAAHWKYKGGKDEGRFEEWIRQVRDLLSEKDANAIEFLNQFRHHLYDNDIYVFTPKGDLRNLPSGATVLDFAFNIHTDLGCKTIGAKIDGKLYPISHKLKNGDQVEIIQSKRQHPNEEWLDYTVTGRARTKIKSYLKNEKRESARMGKEILERKLRSLKVKMNTELINDLVTRFNYSDSLDFLDAIATKSFDLNQLKKLSYQADRVHKVIDKKPEPIDIEQIENIPVQADDETMQHELSVFGGFADKLDYSIAKCCTPVAGDKVFGFITIGKGIRIHRMDCPNAPDLTEKFPYRVVKIKWQRNSKDVLYSAFLQINGIDDIGLVNRITNIISGELKVNMRSISLNAIDGIFEGQIEVYVKDKNEIKNLIKRLKQIEGVYSVKRLGG